MFTENQQRYFVCVLFSFFFGSKRNPYLCLIPRSRRYIIDARWMPVLFYFNARAAAMTSSPYEKERKTLSDISESVDACHEMVSFIWASAAGVFYQCLLPIPSLVTHCGRQCSFHLICCRLRNVLALSLPPPLSSYLPPLSLLSSPPPSLSLSFSVCLCLHPHSLSLNICVCLSVCLSLSFFLSLPPLSPSPPPLSLSVCTPLSVSLSVCLCLYVCLSVCPPPPSLSLSLSLCSRTSVLVRAREKENEQNASLLRGFNSSYSLAIRLPFLDLIL